jgi:hypothetical protein
MLTPHNVMHMADDNQCFVCNEKTKVLMCSKCRIMKYCSPQCQKQDWKVHKKWCGRFEESVCQVLWKCMTARSIYAACMATSLVVSKMLSKKEISHEIVDGYIVMDASKDGREVGVRHVWIEVQGVVLETSLQCRKASHMFDRYSRHNDNFYRYDRETQEEIKESDELEKLIKYYRKRCNWKDTFSYITSHNRMWKSILADVESAT